MTTASASTAATRSHSLRSVEAEAEEDLFVVVAYRDVPTHRLRSDHEADHSEFAARPPGSASR